MCMVMVIPWWRYEDLIREDLWLTTQFNQTLAI
jgi:hypothetical protein